MRTENSFLGLRITEALKSDLQAEAAKRGITLAELVKQRLNVPANGPASGPASGPVLGRTSDSASGPASGPALENPEPKRIVTSEMVSRLNERINRHSEDLKELCPEHCEGYRVALQKASGEQCKQLYNRLGDYIGELYQVSREGPSTEELERGWRGRWYDFLHKW